jgi:thiol-disulfide isomerase/thioredoxin
MRFRATSYTFAALLLSLVMGCGHSRSSTEKGYIFKSASSPVQVDTAGLRRQKARAGIASCPAVAIQRSAVEGGLPHVTLPCLGGGPPVDLASIRGRPGVINLWAQSCAPCRQESPIIERFHEQAGDVVRVLGIDFQDSLPGKAIAFAAAYHLTYPQLADPDAALKGPLRVAGLPVTVFVKSDGRVAHTEYGPIRSLAELQSLVRTYLGVRT